MGRLLVSLFLIINSLIGYLFYEGTLFGDFLSDLSLGGQLIFVILNFLISHLINIRLNTIFSFLSVLGLFFLGAIFALLFAFWVPYWVVFELFNLNDQRIFPWVIYFFALMILIVVLMRPVIVFILDFLLEFNTNFWEGLKSNAIASAIEKAKKNNIRSVPKKK